MMIQFYVYVLMKFFESLTLVTTNSLYPWTGLDIYDLLKNDLIRFYGLLEAT